MGYDFSFARLAPRPQEFPLSPPVGGPWKVEALRSPAAVEKLIAESGRARPNGAAGAMRFYRWEARDGGFLDVSVAKKSVQLDVHAHWETVAELYALLLPLEADLLIADNQTGAFYDAAAFDAFIIESYQPPR
jgi:hypothetical protein